ncbi:YtxH domain-containing protein [Nannocystaceae bacterium ST9]
MGGAIAGAGVAYLTAPASGEETRKRMRGVAHDANVAAHHMPDAVRLATEAAREAFVEALDIGGEAPVVAKTRRAVGKGGKSKSS